MNVYWFDVASASVLFPSDGKGATTGTLTSSHAPIISTNPPPTQVDIIGVVVLVADTVAGTIYLYGSDGTTVLNDFPVAANQACPLPIPAPITVPAITVSGTSRLVPGARGSTATWRFRVYYRYR